MMVAVRITIITDHSKSGRTNRLVPIVGNQMGRRWRVVVVVVLEARVDALFVDEDDPPNRKRVGLLPTGADGSNLEGVHWSGLLLGVRRALCLECRLPGLLDDQ